MDWELFLETHFSTKQVQMTIGEILFPVQTRISDVEMYKIIVSLALTTTVLCNNAPHKPSTKRCFVSTSNTKYLLMYLLASDCHCLITRRSRDNESPNSDGIYIIENSNIKSILHLLWHLMWTKDTWYRHLESSLLLMSLPDGSLSLLKEKVRVVFPSKFLKSKTIAN